MVSENILHSRMKYYLPFALFVVQTVAGFLLAREEYAYAMLLMFSGAIIAWIIVRLYDSTNKAVEIFFSALRNDDTSLSFPVRIRNKSLAKLHESMNALNRHFQSIRMQNEFNENYYRALIRHSATGLVVLNNHDEVELINQVACKYAGISSESTNPNLLKIKNPEFFEALCKLKPGEDITYKQMTGKDLQVLSFRASLLHKKDSTVKLISLQDIRYELEIKELESFRKLISVLTHEIMNLMSPLTSVSKALFSIYHRDNKPIRLTDMDENTLKTTLNCLQVIDEQTNGILNFINNYRRISRIPDPEIKPVGVEEWLEQLTIVYNEKMRQLGIEFTIRNDRQISSLLADKNLLNQVIVNLINNAIDSVMENENRRRIGIELASASRNRTWISVTNNGPKIPPELREKIFVPFFTTKTNGSGIGLSISQEIMKLHKGSLITGLSADGDTAFILEL